MGTKKIKKENPHLTKTIVDVLAYYDISETNKYTQFLVKMLNMSLEGPYINLESTSEFSELFQTTSMENALIQRVSERLIGYENLRMFVEFSNLMEKNLIEKKDISNYNSWDEIEHQLYVAKNKQNFKNSKKEYKKIFEDDTHLIIRPLNYNTSCTYGYQTKWCTASIREPDYFYKHSKGILIYVIDKKTDDKFAFYKDIDMSSEDYKYQTPFIVYNKTDYRIDSFETGLPHNLLKIIHDELQTNVPNYKFFTNEEIGKMLNYVWIDNENKIIPKSRCLLSEMTTNGLQYQGPLFDDIQPTPSDYLSLPDEYLNQEEQEFLMKQNTTRIININEMLEKIK